MESTFYILKRKKRCCSDILKEVVYSTIVVMCVRVALISIVACYCYLIITNIRVSNMYFLTSRIVEVVCCHD